MVFCLVAMPLSGRAETNAAGRFQATTNSASPDAVEKDYRALLEEDDAAQAEIDRWIVDNNAFKEKGAGAPDSELNSRIRGRFDKVKGAYERFISTHPEHVRARLAYGSLLNDLQDELGARAQWEKALELDTNNAAIYNNLAGAYSESGQWAKVFQYYTKAIELKPDEALYYHNFANSLWVLRKAAVDNYKISEQQVFLKCLNLFSNACRLAPDNFPFASDLAQTYYAIQPLQVEPALQAWTNAMRLGHDDLEKQGGYLHISRLKMLEGKYPEARRALEAVTLDKYDRLKTNLLESIEQREHPRAGTNSPAKTP